MVKQKYWWMDLKFIFFDGPAEEQQLFDSMHYTDIILDLPALVL